MKNLIIFNFFMFLVLNANALELDAPTQIKLIENNIINKLKLEKDANKKIKKAYLDFANESTYYSQTDTALYLLNKSLKYFDPKKSKLLVYDKMMALSVFSGDFQLGAKIYKEYLEEFKKHKRSSEDNAARLMFKVLLSDKVHNELLSKKEVKTLLSHSRFPEAIRQHDIKIFFQNKNYQQVYELYKGEKIKRARIDEKIIHDISATLSKNKAELLCKSSYDKYPQARFSSYSLLICKMLVDKKKGKKTKKSDTTLLTNLLKKYPSKRYLASLIDDLEVQ